MRTIYVTLLLIKKYTVINETELNKNNMLPLRFKERNSMRT